VNQTNLSSTMIEIDRFDASRDLEAMLEIEAVSFTNPTTREMLVWEIEHSDVARIYVARVSGESIVGVCSCWLVFDELHINTLAVRPAWRRRGIARKLLVEVLRRSAEEGATRATLEVRRSNEAARRLYAGLRFEERGVRPGYYTRPPEDALILWREGLDGGDPPLGQSP
jgi:ribosomal-protein-alanine N-acetyltransferase